MVTTALSLKAHPLSFIREKLRMLHILSSKELADAKDGSPVKVAGLVLVRQRPGTAGGVCFITVEDETGFSNLVVFQHLFDKYRKEILGSKLLWLKVSFSVKVLLHMLSLNIALIYLNF